MWSAKWYQPTAFKNNNNLFFKATTTFDDLLICMVVDVYPEDRDINYVLGECKKCTLFTTINLKRTIVYYFNRLQKQDALSKNQ